MSGQIAPVLTARVANEEAFTRSRFKATIGDNGLPAPQNDPQMLQMDADQAVPKTSASIFCHLRTTLCSTALDLSSFSRRTACG